MDDWRWDETSESDNSCHFFESRPPDVLIAERAAAQHGTISWDQLRECGLTPQQIRYRVAIGRLHVIHYKVYAVGHDRLTQDGRWMAAVLAGGLDAALSHRSAAALWGVRPRTGGAIEVSVP